MKPLTVLLLVAAAAAPAIAGATPLALYPLERAREDDDVAVVASLLDAAVHQAARRSDVRPADPLFVRARCGAASAASRACLAEVAGKGLMVRSSVRRSRGIIIVSLEAVDRHARSFGPVNVGLETAIQNSEPLTRALLDLAERAEAPLAVAVAPDASPGLAPKPRDPLTTPPLRAPPPATWHRTVAPLLGACGVALATVGGMYAASGQSLSNKLERKRAAGTLTEGDAQWVEEQQHYEDVSRSFLIAGAAFGAAGLAVWAVSPSVAPVNGGVTVGVNGKF